MKQATRDKMIAEYQERKKEVQKQGYEINNRGYGSYSFSKNGKKSVLGFDSECEVVNFISKYQPEANKIFFPYK